MSKGRSFGGGHGQHRQSGGHRIGGVPHHRAGSPHKSSGVNLGHAMHVMDDVLHSLSHVSHSHHKHHLVPHHHHHYGSPCRLHHQPPRGKHFHLRNFGRYDLERLLGILYDIRDRRRLSRNDVDFLYRCFPYGVDHCEVIDFIHWCEDELRYF